MVMNTEVRRRHAYSSEGDTVLRVIPALLRNETKLISSWHLVRRVPWRKRFLDLAVMVAASPVLVPLMLGIAAYIKLVSPWLGCCGRPALTNSPS
jgi:lipopolysaccharide/colanic/teichoic acid biosynthesis glycosyltransferase